MSIGNVGNKPDLNRGPAVTKSEPVVAKKGIDAATAAAMQSVAAGEVADLGESLKSLTARTAVLDPQAGATEQSALLTETVAAFEGMKQRYLAIKPTGEPAGAFASFNVPTEPPSVALAQEMAPQPSQPPGLRGALDRVSDAAWEKLLAKQAAPPDMTTPAAQFLQSPAGKQVLAQLTPLVSKVYTTAKEATSKAEPLVKADVVKLKSTAGKLLESPHFANMDINEVMTLVFMLIVKDAGVDLQERLTVLQNNMKKKQLKRDELRLLKDDRAHIEQLMRDEFGYMQSVGMIKPDAKFEDYAKFRKITWGQAKVENGQVKLTPGKLFEPRYPDSLPPSLAGPMLGKVDMSGKRAEEGGAKASGEAGAKSSGVPVSAAAGAATTSRAIASGVITSVSAPSPKTAAEIADASGLPLDIVGALQTVFEGSHSGEAKSFAEWLKQKGVAYSGPPARAETVVANRRALYGIVAPDSDRAASPPPATGGASGGLDVDLSKSPGYKPYDPLYLPDALCKRIKDLPNQPLDDKTIADALDMSPDVVAGMRELYEPGAPFERFLFDVKGDLITGAELLGLKSHDPDAKAKIRHFFESMSFTTDETKRKDVLAKFDALFEAKPESKDAPPASGGPATAPPASERAFTDTQVNPGGLESEGSLSMLDAQIEKVQGEMDAIGDQSQIDQLKMQQALEHRTKALEFLSNAMKKNAETDGVFINNIK